MKRISLSAFESTQNLSYTQDIDLNVIHEIELKYKSNVERFSELDLKSRPYQTYLDCKVPEIEIDLMNQIIEQDLKIRKDINMWLINVITYAAAITLIERHGKPKPSKINNIKSSKEPNYVIKLKSQIESIRRKISHIDVVIEIKENSIIMKIGKKTLSMSNFIIFRNECNHIFDFKEW